MSCKTLVACLCILFLVLGCKAKTKEELLSEGSRELKANNAQAAIIHLKNALEKDPNYFEARYQLAKAYAAGGKFEQAEKEFQKVLRQDPSNHKDIVLELAGVYVQMNQPDKAIEGARDYLAARPDDPKGLEVLGYAFLAKNLFAEAEQQFSRAVQRDPGRAEPKLGLASVYLAGKKQAQARAVLNEAVSQAPTDTRAYYMLAQLEASSGSSDKAVAFYRKIAEMNPNDRRAPYRSGLLYVEKADFAKAEAVAADLQARFPSRPEGTLLKGIILYHQKKPAEAVIELQKSLRVQPTAGTYYYLGLSHYNRNELEQAINALQKAADMAPAFSQARIVSAAIFLRQNRPDAAIAEIGKVMQVDENNALAYNILGSAYMAKNKYDEAIKELNTALTLDPGLVDAHLKKGYFNLSRGKSQEAEAELKTAVRIAPEVLNTRLVLASYYTRQKRYDKAAAVLSEGLKGTKEDAVLYNAMAAAYFAGRKPEQALSSLQKAKDLNPDYFAPYFNLATYYLVRGEQDKALEEYRSVLKRDPANAQALASIASAYELKGKESDALAYYRKAADTKNPAAYAALSNYHLRKKETDKALAVLDEGIKADPKNLDLLELKGRVYLGAARYKEALAVFEQVEAKNASKGLGLAVQTYLTQRDYGAAIRKLEPAAKAQPDRLDLRAEIARIYGLMGDGRRAVENAEMIIRQKPGSAQGYTVLAALYQQQDNLDAAVDALKKGLKADEKSAPAAMMLGNLYVRKKEFNLALSTFEGVSRRDPRNVPSIFAQGTVYEQTGRKKEAVRKYREALTVSDDYLPALNNLAYLYADGYGSKEEALEMAARAYRIAPAKPEVLDTLGYALLKNGRKDEALKALKKAAEGLPDNPTVQYHLALAYNENGDKTQAAEKLKKAVSLGDFSESGSARTLLAQLENPSGRKTR